uniref:Uncharacterized protein n=1 Tax=Panagrolaimus sp. ES5 TaxID=591445 RepID=A0AC34G6J4_9BILA
SDSELLELERALQNKIEEFENEKNGFVEDSIPIRLNNNNNNFDNRRYLQAMEMRERRAGGRSSPIGSGSANMVPVLNEDGGVELFPIMEDEQQPIVVIEEPVTEEEMLQQQINGGEDGDDRQFVLIPEGDDEMAEAEAEGLIPIELIQDEIQSQQQPQELLLSENDIDELELRQRLAQLGDDEIAEAEAEGLIPIEMFQDEIQSQQQQQPQELLLSENDIDELELRQRLAQLGEQLTKRSIQGF